MAWVPNSIPIHFHMGPTTLGCALLPLETNESYHRCMQKQNWLLWETPGGIWGSCMTGADIWHQQGGTGIWEVDSDFNLTLLRSNNLLPNSLQPPFVQRDASLRVDCKTKDCIKCWFAFKKSQCWWCFPGFHFPIGINVVSHISVTFIQAYYSWVAKCCLCP